MNYHKTPPLVESANSAPYNTNGNALRRRLRGAAATTKAIMAHKLARGEIVLTGMGLKRAAHLCGASLGYVETLSRLSPDDLARVRAHPRMLAQLHQRGREMSDADIDKLVAHVGAGRLMEALDRATAPAPFALATE